MTISRRTFLKYASSSMALLGAASMFGCQSPKHLPPQGTWWMPDESHTHRRTWMAFGGQDRIWGELLPFIRADLAKVANTIVQYEPVSMLVRPDERELAADLLNEGVDLIDVAMDDLWIRDTGPTFVFNDAGQLGGVDLNFNGWGNKQRHRQDAKLANFVAELANAEHITTELVGEEGGIEVDGQGTAIITESCFLNDNRNPGLSKANCETILKGLFGLRKIIWLPGIRGKDITDGHTDFYARFAKPGVVIAALEMDRAFYDYKVTREHLSILEKATDADWQKLEIITLETPSKVRSELENDDFAAGYVNYYVVNGAVIAPEFGDDKADAKCKETLEKLFPKRDVVQLNIDAIAAGGGGIHCVTQQEPAATFTKQSLPNQAGR